MESHLGALQSLVDEFRGLPGIGQKSAERLAYYVLREPAEAMLRLSDAIRRVKVDLRNCSRCFHIAEGELCSICSDDTRDHSLICVVEQSKDLFAIEQSGSFRGGYHVLQGVFAPLEGVTPDDLTIAPLIARLKTGAVRELILATNPNFEGDGTALYLREQVEREVPAVRITRIARGIPSGSNLEHVGRNIVADALDGRKEMESTS